MVDGKCTLPAGYRLTGKPQEGKCQPGDRLTLFGPCNLSVTGLIGFTLTQCTIIPFHKKSKVQCLNSVVFESLNTFDQDSCNSWVNSPVIVACAAAVVASICHLCWLNRQRADVTCIVYLNDFIVLKPVNVIKGCMSSFDVTVMYWTSFGVMMSRLCLQ